MFRRNSACVISATCCKPRCGLRGRTGFQHRLQGRQRLGSGSKISLRGASGACACERHQLPGTLQEMKTFVFLACACAFAQAQFGSPQYQTSSSAQNAGHFGRSRFQTQSTASPQYQEDSNQYQYQQAAAQSQNGGYCREKNDRYPVPGSCDRYVECVNGTSEEKLCPDGLRFNPNVNFNVYPCQYPNDVPCLERSSLQPPQPTAECPHQFGFFKVGDARNCSSFRSCVNGVAYDFTCPDGLAYNSETYRCDWPDEVADCDAEAFLGFRCPETPVTKELGPPAGYRYYRSETDCQRYFICINDKPRVLSCGGDAAFDELVSTCVSADEVPYCPPELQASARRAREEEQQRLAKQLEFDSRPGPPPHKRRF